MDKVRTMDKNGFELSLHQFWTTAMKDIITVEAKRVISAYETGEINKNRNLIGKDLKEAVVVRLAALGYPVVTSDTLIIDLEYPKEITESRKKIKMAILLDLENAALAQAAVAKATRDAELALEKNKAKVIDAQGDAEANRIRSESLTPSILALKLNDALMALASGPNNTSIVIPYDALRQDGSMVDTSLIKQAVGK